MILSQILLTGLGFGLRQSTFPLVRARQSAQSAGKAVSPRRPIKRQSGLFWAAKCCFWPRTSHFLGGVLAQFWPWFRAIYRRFLAMVWSQIGNFSPAAHLLSGVPPEPRRLTLFYRGAREKAAKNGWILPGRAPSQKYFPPQKYSALAETGTVVSLAQAPAKWSVWAPF